MLKEITTNIRSVRTTRRLARPRLVENARRAIWRLFQAGYLDDDLATTSLLALDLGLARATRGRRTALVAIPRCDGTH